MATRKKTPKGILSLWISADSATGYRGHQDILSYFLPVTQLVRSFFSIICLVYYKYNDVDVLVDDKINNDQKYICMCVRAHVHVCVAYAKDKSYAPGSLESAVKILFQAYRKEMVVASFHVI